jgi:creatinine amidohydrolase
MNPYILSDLNWKVVQSNEYEIAVLPWGATEPHNFHLPYSTDIIEATEIAKESSKKAWEKGAKVVVLPTIPFGVNTGFIDLKLTININPSTQLALLNDIIFVLNHHKIYKFLIINSHGGNEFQPLLREIGLKYPKMFLCTCNWFEALNKSEYFENDGDHADEMETSLMLYLAPEFVLPLDKAGEGKEKKFKISSLSQGWAWSERKWSKISEDTGVGNPIKASRVKGEKYFKAVTDKIAQVIFDIAKADIENPYE